MRSFRVGRRATDAVASEHPPKAHLAGGRPAVAAEAGCSIVATIAVGGHAAAEQYAAPPPNSTVAVAGHVAAELHAAPARGTTVKLAGGIVSATRHPATATSPCTTCQAQVPCLCEAQRRGEGHLCR